MKKVVHITSVHSPKDSRIFYRECSWLAQNGFEVTYMAPAPTPGHRNVPEPGTAHFIGVKKTSTRLGRPLVWLRLFKKVVSFKPDIIHFHDPELLVTAPFFKWFAKPGVKTVFDVHEYLSESIQDKFWIPVRMRPLVAWLVMKIAFFFGKWVDAQVFVVNGQIPCYARWNTRKIILHNYPDLNHFRPIPGKKSCQEIGHRCLVSLDNPDQTRRDFALVHIGSLYERRGIMTMLKTLDILKTRGYFPRLILGGVFESIAFQKKVKHFIQTHDLNCQVKINGWVDYQDICCFLEEAQAAWLPHYPSAQHAKESICTKQLEAMLAGLPLVVSDIPNLTRFIDEAGCGLCVPALDAGSHADAVQWLMDHPQQSVCMGKKGRQLVLSRYSWQQEAHTLKQLYESL